VRSGGETKNIQRSSISSRRSIEPKKTILRMYSDSEVQELETKRIPIDRIPKSYGTGKLKEPEPLIDVFEERDEIVVVAEFAGFSRENLRVDVKNQKLILSAQASDRKYYKSLNLPNRVISETLRLAHKNGVLEIRIKKVAEEKTIDKVAG
jgi:HSP20 family molecular chaperone IbpA